MTGHIHQFGGLVDEHAARALCADDLDRAILAGTPEAAVAFVLKWGEPLRAILINFHEAVAKACDYE